MLIFAAIILILLAITLNALARFVPGFAEAYGSEVFPYLVASLGRLNGLWSFSLYEILLYGLIIFAIGGLVFFSIATYKNKAKYARYFGLFGRIMLLLTALIFFMFTVGSGINYYRQPLAGKLDLAPSGSNSEQLLQVHDLLLKQMAELNPKRNSDGSFSLDSEQAEQNARQAMLKLSNEYDLGFIFMPNPKPIAWSAGMSQLKISGIYAPFTIEANYNQHTPALSLPFILCHELAHLGGYMPEDEANFIAYLAASGSDDIQFKYSALYTAWQYVYAALSRALDAESFAAIQAALPAQLSADYQAISDFWRDKNGLFARISSASNDIYLQANNQSEGIASYGKMVDLLIAHYLKLGLIGDNALISPEPNAADDIDIITADSNSEAADYLSKNLPGRLFSVGEITAKGAVLIAADSLTVLYGKQINTPLPPASVTKVLTALVAWENIDDLEAKVVLSEADFAGMEEVGASMSGFSIGEEVSYEDLLYTLILRSGCDSANALAHNISGSLTAFADLMNGKLAQLGLENSYFVNPSGLPAEEQLASPLDLAIIMAEAIKIPYLRDLLATEVYQTSATAINPKGLTIKSYFFYSTEASLRGADLYNQAQLLGGKTGFTNAAGLCLAAYADYQGQDYIAIALGAPDVDGYPQPNFLDIGQIFGSLEGF